ncbi:hypothetical protein [Leptolyngbya ohadii]|uniref:hypothetical protein n=1 Tax=Leptolyngbya ohadii TaxID=1962290 RepID=UPI000B598D1C|nr:hypothetical protein [Leptolyngbya ohadii]
MKRRKLLQTGLPSFLLVPFLGSSIGSSTGQLGQPIVAHTPFPQWKVYRQRHLFIAIDRSDLAANELSRTLVEILDRDLPEAEAKVTRAVNSVGIASLLSTEQLDVGLMRTADAVAWMQGAPEFESIEPAALRTLVDLGDYLLLCREDFPDRHASLVAHALTHGIADHPTEKPFPQAAVTSEAVTFKAVTSEAIETIPFHAGVSLRG